jgi:hypothetical protein
MYRFKMFLDANAGNGGGAEDETPPPDETPVSDDPQSQQATEEEEYAKWLETLPKDVRGKLEGHTKGLVSALQKERENGKTLKTVRADLKAFKDAEDKRKRDEMTELEKAKTDLTSRDDKIATLTKALESERIKNAVFRVGKELGFKDPEGDAYALIDLEKISVDPEAGKVSGVKEELEKLAKAKPYLLEKPDLGDGTKTKVEGKKPTKSEEAKKKQPRMTF